MYDRILVPTDGSDAAAAAEREAFDLAEAFGATVRALHVVDAGAANYGADPASDPADLGRDDLPGAADLEEYAESVTADLADAAAERGLDAEREVLVGRPADRIVEDAEASGADLVVMGSRGRSGVSRVLLGSVAERVVRGSSVPVMVVGDDDGAE